MAIIHHTTGLHVPANNTRQGWGIVGIVVLITLAAVAGAYMVHKNTYRHPTHPSATIPNSNTGGH
jgi:hypothetical protein